MVVVIEGRGTRHVYLAAERRRLCRVWGRVAGGWGRKGGWVRMVKSAWAKAQQFKRHELIKPRTTTTT